MKKKLLTVLLVAALAAMPLLSTGCSWLFGTYDIVYVMNDDASSPATYREGEENPAQYTSGLFVTYFNSPVRQGYVFRGWYTTADFSGERLTYVLPGTTGTLTLYAKWERKTTGVTGTEGENPWSGDVETWRGFMPYIDEFDTAYASGTSVSIDSRDELTAYLEYVQYKYITQDDAISVRVTYDYSPKSVQQEIESAYASLYFASYTGIQYTALSSSPKISIKNSSLVGIEGDLTAGDADYYTQILPYEYSEQGAAHEFAIDSVGSVLYPETTNQLFYAVMIGARPVPVENSPAERVYNEARDVLNGVIAEEMTDAEKVEAIFEWMVMNVTYDEAALSYTDASAAAKYDAFYLEGVFETGRAVCDGISKAMTLLCRIEGIPCVRIYGASHAWNKVYVNDRWYIVDATFGDTSTRIENTPYSFMNRKYLLTDETADERYAQGQNYTSSDYAVTEDYNYYGKRTFRYLGVEYDFRIENSAEFRALISWAREYRYSAPYSVDFYVTSASLVTNVRYAIDGNYCTIFFGI